MSPNPAKDTLTTNHCQTLEAMVNTVKADIAKAKAGDTDEGKELLAEAEQLLKRIANLKMFVAKIPIADAKYTGTKDAAIAFQKQAKDVLTALAKKPQTILKFCGAVVADDKALIAKIKEHLPSSGHGNINQAFNDVLLGRGKATTGQSGVLHASAGPQQKGKGCTLFFKRSGSTTDVVGVGQHEEVKAGQKPRYMIHFGMNMKGKVLSL